MYCRHLGRIDGRDTAQYTKIRALLGITWNRALLFRLFYYMDGFGLGLGDMNQRLFFVCLYMGVIGYDDPRQVSLLTRPHGRACTSMIDGF